MGQILLFVLGWILLATAALGQPGPEKMRPEFPDRKGLEFPGGKGMMGPRHHSMEDWARQLNLTVEQRSRLQELRENYLRGTLVWRNELVIKRFDLRDLLRNPQSDPNQVLAKQREISELESKIQEQAILYQLEMRKVLTPDQIKLFPPGFGLGGFGGPRLMPGRGRGMGRE